VHRRRGWRVRRQQTLAERPGNVVESQARRG
jgi:hypothetical protein